MHRLSLTVELTIDTNAPSTPIMPANYKENWETGRKRDKSGKEVETELPQSEEEEEIACDSSYDNTVSTWDSTNHANFFTKRNIPTVISSYLRAGSQFVGTQVSKSQKHAVHVEIKYVDMANFFLCGYFRIQGLDRPDTDLTTYFEGEIIGPKYSFYTRRPEWGAKEKTDLTHWGRFVPWRHIAQKAMDPDYVHEEYDKQDHIYMRWKECFLVPEEQTIQASYAGFYYICFNQVEGKISGLYYHESAVKYQELSLSPVDGPLCFQSFEFA